MFKAPIAATLTLLLLAAGCARPVFVGPDGVGGGRHRPPPSRVSGSIRGDTATTTRLTRKRVDGKEPPSTLLARDGAYCVVSAARYEEIREGDSVWCAWRTPPR